MTPETWNRIAHLAGASFFSHHSERVVDKDTLLRLLAMAAETGSTETLRAVYPASCVYCAEGESDLTYYPQFFDDGWYHGSKDRSEPKRCGASRVRYAMGQQETTSGGGRHGT